MSETTDIGHLEVTKLGSGWAAVHLVNVFPGLSGESYTDIQQTGVGRYPTKLEAVYEARSWSESDGIPFIEPTDG